MLERVTHDKHTEITFVLPPDLPPGPVSVVGEFNEWRPGVNRFEPREDGLRAARVVLPTGERIGFRYLASDGHWLDEVEADAHEDQNNYVFT